MNKRLLLVCYYFPPLGGAGVSRPMALYTYLPQFGFEVDVLTVKKIAHRTYEPELLEGLPTERIYRSRSFDPQRILFLLGMRRLKDKTISKGKKISDRFFPDPKIGWVKSAVKLGRVLVENRQYDAILSSSPPISTHLVAQKLSKEFSIRWLADFRDYWTSYKPEDWFEDSRKTKKAYALLEEIKQESSARTTVSQPIADFLGGADVVYNSFSDKTAGHWTDKADDDIFTIGILGTIDKLCPVTPLFALLENLKLNNKEIYDKLKIIQVGNINDPDFHQLLEQNALKNKIIMHSQQPRTKTVELLNKTHMLYLGLDPKFENGIVTSRIFDMLVSGRSLLCAVTKNSSVSELLSGYTNKVIFQPDDLSSANNFIIEKYQQWKKKELSIAPRSPLAEQYSPLAMAGNFAGILEKLIT